MRKWLVIQPGVLGERSAGAGRVWKFLATQSGTCGLRLHGLNSQELPPHRVWLLCGVIMCLSCGAILVETLGWCLMPIAGEAARVSTHGASAALPS